MKEFLVEKVKISLAKWLETGDITRLIDASQTVTYLVKREQEDKRPLYTSEDYDT